LEIGIDTLTLVSTEQALSIVHWPRLCSSCPRWRVYRCNYFYIWLHLVQVTCYRL